MFGITYLQQFQSVMLRMIFLNKYLVNLMAIGSCLKKGQLVDNFHVIKAV